MDNRTYRILAINPGSTSTKVALFENEDCVFKKTIDHDPADIPGSEVQEQLDFRKNTILQVLGEENIELNGIDVFVGRGGGIVNCAGGVYKVNPLLLEHASIGILGQHPAQLASQICGQFRDEFGGIAYVVNPPDVDEYITEARITGIKDIYRPSQIHALNQKEVALRCCAEEGWSYQNVNLIVAHIGGGISVAAHRKGKMIDSNNILQGDGPMAPTRCGSIPVRKVIELCFDGRFSKKELLDKTSKTGGLMDLLGTADVREVEARIAANDKYARTVYDSMIYQIAKSIGSMAVSLRGDVQKIILTGGISRSEYMVTSLKEQTGWIAPFFVMAGEFEMEALACGALRVLRKEEEAIDYQGTPVWTPSDLY